MYLDYEPGLTTVKVGGGWYVTAVGTVIDNVLRDEFDDLRNLRDYEVGEPDYDAVVEEVEPIVGEDPEEALANLAEAVAGEDFEQLLANFPADQVVALRPYVRLVEDSLAYEGTSLDAVVTDLDLTESDAGGNLVKVTIGGATMLGTMHQNGASFTGEVAVDGRCFDGTGYEEYDGYQDYDEGRFCLDGDVVDYTGIDEVYVMMRQVGGGYQVDLLATAIAYAQAAIEAVPSSAFDRALSEICYDMQGYDTPGALRELRGSAGRAVPRSRPAGRSARAVVRPPEPLREPPLSHPSPPPSPPPRPRSPQRRRLLRGRCRWLRPRPAVGGVVVS